MGECAVSLCALHPKVAAMAPGFGIGNNVVTSSKNKCVLMNKNWSRECINTLWTIFFFFLICSAFFVSELI